MTMTLDLPPDVLGAIGEAARQHGQTPEEAAAQALRALFSPFPGDGGAAEDARDAEQERYRATVAGLIAEAQALTPEPPDARTRQAYRDSPVDEVIVEKFRRQGFTLEKGTSPAGECRPG